MRSLRSIPVALKLLTGVVAPLSGQVVEPHVGDRVRLRTMTGAQPVEGTVLRFHPDTLVLAPRGEPALGGQLVIPLGSVQTMDVWRGRRSAWRSGAEIGSFAGFVAASAIFAARMQRCVGWECGKSARWLPYAAAGSLAGAAAGSLVGLLVGHDRWERAATMQVRPQLAQGGRGVGVGLSLRF